MPQPAITLTIQQSAQRGQRFSVTKDSIVIGRVAGSDVVISDPEVSRRHASITWEEEQPVIRDLGSTNGTFVNGVRITGPRALRDGDAIGLGKVQFPTLNTVSITLRSKRTTVMKSPRRTKAITTRAGP